MKVKFACPVVIAGALALAACGSDGAEEAVQEEEAEAAETQASDGSGQANIRKQMQALDYTEFELEVEYDNDEEYEAELELKPDDSVVAGYEDDMNGIKKQGIEAFNDLYPLVEQLELTPSSNQEEEVQKVLSTFSLPDNFTDFSLELRFSDGTKRDFEVEQ
ncbi:MULTISPECIES: YusW family protein [Bhargavaea]|uniref:YusW family protein n=1 Tax=Bhargavaea changchunensis TaxID=2134037 RepID=A0ABW2NCF7_9BACL|nr:YusW family protein [Bhargavaea sp. CC-171006]